MKDRTPGLGETSTGSDFLFLNRDTGNPNAHRMLYPTLLAAPAPLERSLTASGCTEEEAPGAWAGGAALPHHHKELEAKRIFCTT